MKLKIRSHLFICEFLTLELASGKVEAIVEVSAADISVYCVILKARFRL